MSEVAKNIPTGPGIVAVSGGADSVALLRALVELDAPVTVAHVNHQLRGAESDGDEEFVTELAGRLNLPFRSTKITLPENENLEEAGRRVRYGWLTDLGKKLDANWLATAHTADDQAETVLHRIIRGTSLRGLQGIFPLIAPTETTKPSILRPLLRLTRGDVVSYLDLLKQPFCLDSSNNDRRFTRNRIRHELLPLLKDFNPGIVASLCQLADQAGETTRFLYQESWNLFSSAQLPPAGTLRILDRTKLTNISPFLLRCMFSNIWLLEDWPRGEMTFEHWQRLANLEPGDYPGGIRLTLTERVVQLGPRS